MASQDVEMMTVRRSTRVVPKSQKSTLTSPQIAPKKRIVKRATKATKANKAKTSGKSKRNTSSRRKATKRIKTLIDKFADLSKARISDLFCLVKKYAILDEERHEKYIVLQTILKGMKENQIHNTLVDLYTHKHRLACYIVTKLLSTSSPLCFTRISQHIEDVLSYKEVDGVDCIPKSNLPATTTSSSSQNTMDVDSSALQEGIDALDALQSIFRRLIV